MSRPGETKARRTRRASNALTAISLVGAILLLAVPSVPRGRRDSKAEIQRTAPTPDSKAIDAIAEILSPPASGPEPRAADLVERIHALGEPALPVAIGILCGEIALPAFAVGSPTEPVHPRAVELREEVLKSVLAKNPPAHVVELLVDHVDQRSSLDVRLAVVQLIGNVDAKGSVDAILGLARAIEPLNLERSYVQVRLEEALTKRLELAPGAGSILRGAMVDQNSALWPMLARVAEHAHSPDVAAFLVSTLGRNPELDVVALQSLADRCERFGVVLGDAHLASLRPLIESTNERVQRTAITVLGRIRDRESVPAIIDALTHDSVLVAQSAHDALHTLAQSDLGESPAAWSAWYERETSWWEKSQEELEEQVQSDIPAKLIAATRTWLEHPLFTREAANSLALVVLKPEERPAEAAIDALKRLGSSHCIRGLVAALDRDDDVRERAAAALRSVTGLDLPADAKAWRSVVAFDE